MRHVPNTITVTRGLLGPVILAVYLLSAYNVSLWAQVAVFVLYALAASSDAFDGPIARKYVCVSEFGKTVDPLSDKALFWFSAVILWREGYANFEVLHGLAFVFFGIVIVYDLATLALRVLNQLGAVSAMHTTRIAKWKTIYLLAGLGIFLAMQMIPVYFPVMLIYLTLYAAIGIGFTVASSYVYVRAIVPPSAERVPA